MTRRTVTFFIVSFIFYFLASQTQVGWLYVISALLLGLIPAAWWLNRGMLRPITAVRTFTSERQQTTNQAKPAAYEQPELYEGDDVTVQLALHNHGRFASFQIRATEQCSLAAPDSPARTMQLFAPQIPAQSSVPLHYDVTIDRRGVHTFPSPRLQTKAPFGFFRRRRRLDLQTRVLVYPELKRLRRFDLFHRQRLAEREQPRQGRGSEVMGVRPYQLGDSPRHIHWRSVARHSRLISKEFADEAQPGLTLLLDLYHHPYPTTDSKHTSFEWAVKVAASVGEFAHRGGYPIHLVADETALTPPRGPVSWRALLAYLAQVQPTGKQPLPALLEQGRYQSFVTAVLPWPDLDLISPLTTLRHRGVTLLAAIIDPASFPQPGPSAQPLAQECAAHSINLRLIRFGDDWTKVLQNANNI